MTRIERQKQPIKPIPPFAALEEGAEFWDSHSMVDKIDDGTQVGFHRTRKSGSLTVRLQPDDIRRIREEANQLGIGPTTLVRMWILEHLRQRKTA